MRTRQRLPEGEQGAVAIIVAIFIAVVVLGIAALAIDGGALLRTQRALATDTDAMALAGARLLGDYPDCSSTARAAVNTLVKEVGTDNDVTVVDDDIDIDCSGSRRLVTVRAREASPGWFSGRDDLSAANVSTVDASRLNFTDLSICQGFTLYDPAGDPPFYDIDEVNEGEVDPPLWSLGDSPLPDSSTGLVNVPYGSGYDKYDEDTQAAMCEDNSGNPEIPGGWGWLDGGVSAVGGNPFDCRSGGDGNWCSSDTGNRSLTVARGEAFNFPVFEAGRSGGAGGEFKIVGIGQAVLIGCSGGGNPGPPNNLKDVAYEGTCGTGSGTGGGQPVWISLQMFGYRSIDPTDAGFNDALADVFTRTRICGVRATDGECVGF